MLLEAERPVRPGLRVEVTAGRRLLLRQTDRVVLLGLQRARHQGVHYARTGLYRSPLPPIKAAHARQVRQTSRDDDAWAARWAHRFVDSLQATTEGPLHTGRWMVARGMPSWSVAAHWQRLQTIDPDQGHITWFGYGHPAEDQRDVLPLRRLSPVGAARVRAYRRQFHEGILPPALLWWVSGLSTLLVLDGHDRITAALAEHALPEVVVLAPAADPSWISALQHHAVRAYQGRIEYLQTSTGHDSTHVKAYLANVSRRFAGELDGIVRSEGRTRAWPLPGGSTAWEQHAVQAAFDWHTKPM